MSDIHGLNTEGIDIKTIPRVKPKKVSYVSEDAATRFIEAENDMRRPSIPNVYMMPGFDPSQVSRTLEAQFQTDQATIEQTGLYINPSSGSRWQIVANQTDYVETQAASAPYHEIASHIAHEYLTDVEELDIFGLGSGDGKSETRLTQQLYKYIKALNLFLLDVSQPLMKVAVEHAKSVLSPPLQERVKGVLGNMHHLAQGPYADLYPPEPKTRRLVTMLGYTLGNLEHEAGFIKNSLVGFNKGDLLLIDVVRAFAPADQPKEVKKRDPRLANTNPQGWNAAYEEFLSDTIFHYCRGSTKVDFIQELDYSSCSIAGSYSVVMKAKVHYYDGKIKTFNLMQYKRYDANLLVDSMERLNWRASCGWFYGNNCMLYLFEKDF